MLRSYGRRTDKTGISRGGEWRIRRSAAIPMGGDGLAVKPSAQPTLVRTQHLPHKARGQKRCRGSRAVGGCGPASGQITAGQRLAGGFAGTRPIMTWRAANRSLLAGRLRRSPACLARQARVRGPAGVQVSPGADSCSRTHGGRAAGPRPVFLWASGGPAGTGWFRSCGLVACSWPGTLCA
jgi:hypothetical protein